MQVEVHGVPRRPLILTTAHRNVGAGSCFHRVVTGGANVPKLVGILVDVYKTDMADSVRALGPRSSMLDLQPSNCGLSKATSTGIGQFALRCCPQCKHFCLKALACSCAAGICCIEGWASPNWKALLLSSARASCRFRGSLQLWKSSACSNLHLAGEKQKKKLLRIVREAGCFRP